MNDQEYDARVAQISRDLMNLKWERHGNHDDATEEWRESLSGLAQLLWENIVVAYTGTEEDVRNRTNA